jgi:23S rRNA (uracil1939-C5)-methyltransferase
MRNPRDSTIGMARAHGRSLAADMATIIECRITDLAHGGDGIGRPEGSPVVFVPATVPGDLVRVEMVSRAKDYARGVVVEVLEAGQGRRSPPCPESAACGGCQWQHVEEKAQALAARDLLVSALRRSGRLDVSGVEVADTLVVEPVLRGRQRARFHARLDASAPGLGFHRRGSHDVHVMEECLALEPELERLRRAVGSALPRVARALRGLGDCDVEIALPREDAAVLQLVGRASAAPAAAVRGACAALQATSESLRSVEVVVRDGAGRTTRARQGEEAVRYLRGTVLEPEAFVAYLSPGGFMQASRAGNLALTSRVLAAARSGAFAGEEVLELFAGNGNFTLPLAAEGARVTAVEGDERAVRNLARAAGEHGLEVDARADSVESELRHLAARGRRFPLVVMDPPRTGARAEVALLPRLGVERLVYVSCDAVTLARDAAVLAAAGLRLVRAEPLLLFPQTAHFETVACFEAGA